MKAILLFLLIALTLNVQSQSSVYHPFPTTNAAWEYVYFNDFHQPAGLGGYWITGDTLISGKNYKHISGCDGMNGFCNSGGIRDSGRVIYFIPDTSSTEYVLYDFNLNLGDTLINPFAYNGGYPAVFVSEVDSQLTSDGYHRLLRFNTMDSWIEGIGSTTYFFAPTDLMGVSGNDELTCMSTDSGFHYPNWIAVCVVSVNDAQQNRNDIEIIPNPFHFSSIVKLPIQFERVELKIYNSIGSLLISQFIESKNLQFKLDQGELNEGMYFLQIVSDENQSVIKFIID